MYTDIGKLLEEMRGIQEQLERFFDEARDKFRYTLEDGRVRFSSEVQQLHHRYRVSSLRYLLDADLLSVLTAPLVYSMLVPLAILDAGLADTYRLTEQPANEYSWWDYRMNGFKRNLGLRIDLTLASTRLCQAHQSSQIDSAPRGWERPSDHAPVIAEFAL